MGYILAMNHHDPALAAANDDPAAKAEPFRLRSILLPVLIGPGIIALWAAIMALVYVLFEPGQTVMVFGPQHKTFPAVVAADAQVLSSGEGFLVVRGNKSGYVRKLYSGGAVLVMPTTEMMCGHPGAIRKIATGR
ncbi:MAG: hypothetical protein KDJ29_10320 [Hyphomicrobiales bacterium]|nr:hypothetical protein [Hyphomicrobiales bacterium]